MTPKERWLALVNREKPDRVPMIYRSTREATQKLLNYLNCRNTNEMFERLHIDRSLGVSPDYVGPSIPAGEDLYGRRYKTIQHEKGA
ncbi:MAG: uroporphyrinogen-III decarboxylase-like protein, partial [Candidatus Latescibacteria bacterium]|nr:uroporphyrinogen-III decarboxylase-like protein [Candidatus Latescibacterota bacterium]